MVTTRTCLRLSASLLAVVLASTLLGCQELAKQRKENALHEAEQLQAAGDFPGAVARYEAALDGTDKTAEAHFRLALLYMDKLHDPLSAVHHLRRYLALAPHGTYAREAKDTLDREEMTMATNLGEGTLLTHAEALRLKNENAELHRQLAERNAAPAGAPANRAAPPSGRTYKVLPGDTLANISRKFYKTKGRYKDIQDANMNSLGDPPKLKPGMTLIIP